VHFLRFELDPAMIASARAGATIGAGIDHDNYRHALEPVPPETQAALCVDFA
jgi:hypothetical protein